MSSVVPGELGLYFSITPEEKNFVEAIRYNFRAGKVNMIIESQILSRKIPTSLFESVYEVKSFPSFIRGNWKFLR